MVHTKERLDNKKEFADSDFTPNEAIEWMLSRVSMTKEEYYNKIDGKARYRAFTVSRLTEIDAIERTKDLLARTIKEGETISQWRDRLKEDEILKKIGFHEENPYYLENVFRTNVSSAYNAGRWEEQLRNKEEIALLEYVAIDDDRITPICSRLDGIKLPVDDPFWEKYYPPNHFGCRSGVREIQVGTDEAESAQPTPKEELKDLPEIKGFDNSPSVSWWEESDSMKKRAEKYGLDKEFKKKKNILLKNSEKDSIINNEKKFKIKDYNVEDIHELRNDIKEKIIPLNIKTAKQNQHIKGTKEFIKNGKNKSYFNENFNASEFIEKYAGTGEFIFVKNKWIQQEIITGVSIIGIYKTLMGKEYETKNFKIHYSKDGVHVVPYKPL